ncbi:MAG TPA: GAF domain-containing protein, partial [Candidatus Bathyarchaeia archaeon]|nr:GAF domain-containing protein [Candidatus Bathyarchaeia archaeon]
MRGRAELDRSVPRDIPSYAPHAFYRACPWESTMTCRRCRRKAPPGAESCPKCGALLGPPTRGRLAAGVHPILEAIARTAARLCEAREAQIVLAEGENLVIVAQHGSLRAHRTLGEPFPLSRGSVYGRAALEHRVIHVRDLKAVFRTQYPDIPPATPVRTMLAVPLLSDGALVGVIALRRLQVRPFTPKQIALLETFAAQAAIAIEKDRLSEAVASRNRDLAEALDHQTATAEVLSVISASPTNVQSVFETIVSSARRLCEASFSSLNLLEGDQLMLTALDGMDQRVAAAARQSYPQPVNRSTTSGRAILERSVVHIEDTALDPEYTNPVRSALVIRSVLTVPMFREGRPIGAVSVWRGEVKPFTLKQIALLQTFADQAVIAIANARLFHDLTEALEQQTATSEILRAISTSAMDAQPVFEAILEAGVRLIGALFGSVYRFDGTLLHMVAHHNYPAPALEFSRRIFPTPPTRRLVTGRAILERAVVHVPDVLQDEERPYVQQFAEVSGFTSALSVPMLRDGKPIGAITLWHIAPFSDSHIALLKTFADQAVIAVENARLFKELEARNRDLTEGLERETATGEILRVLSSSPTDIQPVLEAILDSGKRLCAAEFGAIFRFDGDAFVLAASTMISTEFATWIRSHPIRPGRSTPLTRVGLEHRSIQVADILADPDFAPPDIYRREGMRTALAVPIVKGDTLLGAMTFHRHAVQPFTDQQIALLETFAAQAVIAIENVRLFTELGARNAELTEALDQQTATAEILRVIGSSPTDVNPVFRAIVRSATTLCDATFGIVFRFDGEQITVAANQDLSPEEIAVTNAVFPAPATRGTAAGRAIVDRRVVHISDIRIDPDYVAQAPVNALGYRTALAVPMLREGNSIGVFVMWRREVRPFTDKQIDLVRTFADQAVIAIENVRLFKELEARNRDLTEALEQQTATAEILRVISSSPTDLGPVMDTVAENAARLCEASDAQILRADGETITLVASYGTLPTVSREPRPLSRRLIGGRAIIDRATLHIPDVTIAQDEYPDTSTVPLGIRTALAIPLLREGVAIGAILIRRMEVRPFSDKQVQLLRTFADQAVIAIENVRLFKELEARNRDLTEALEQQTATSEILRVISQSQTDVQPVFDTI